MKLSNWSGLKLCRIPSLRFSSFRLKLRTKPIIYVAMDIFLIFFAYFSSIQAAVFRVPCFSGDILFGTILLSGVRNTCNRRELDILHAIPVCENAVLCAASCFGWCGKCETRNCVWECVIDIDSKILFAAQDSLRARRCNVVSVCSMCMEMRQRHPSRLKINTIFNFHYYYYYLPVEAACIALKKQFKLFDSILCKNGENGKWRSVNYKTQIANPIWSLFAAITIWDDCSSPAILFARWRYTHA